MPGLILRKRSKDDFQTAHPAIAKMLGTNCTPSDDEKAHIRESLRTAERSLADVGAEIVRTQQLLVELEETRDELQGHVQSLKTLVSPAKDLPVELWEQVFRHCLPDEALTRPWEVGPLVLGQVCRGWRNLVYASPRLWASLALQTTARHERRADEQRSKEMIGFYLARAAACPVSMSLVAGAQFQACRTPSSRLTPIWEALLPHSSHLHRLELRVPESSITPLLMSSVQDFPMLETLAIDVSPEIQAHQPSFTLARAPKLRSVELLHITFDIRPLHIRYSQLTSLTVLPQSWAKPETFLTLDDCLDILAQGTSLHTCTLAVEDSMPARALAVTSRVAHFHIMFRDSDRRADMRGAQPARVVRLGHFFDLVQLPALRALTVSNFAGNFADLDSWPHDRFVSLLARSAAPLAALHLCYIPATEAEMVQALRLAPALAELVVEVRQRTGAQRPAGDELLRALTAGGAPACVAPALRALDFRYCGKRCTEAGIIAFVESRRGKAARALESFKIQISHPPSVELARRIALWGAGGMEVEVSHDEFLH